MLGRLKFTSEEVANYVSKVRLYNENLDLHFIIETYAVRLGLDLPVISAFVNDIWIVWEDREDTPREYTRINFCGKCKAPDLSMCMEDTDTEFMLVCRECYKELNDVKP